MSLLQGRLELGGVRDVEALAQRAVTDATRNNGGYLSPHDREDAVSAVVVAAWRVSSGAGSAVPNGTKASATSSAGAGSSTTSATATAGRGGGSQIMSTSASTSPTSASTTSLLEGLDWMRLSPEGRWILKRVGIPLSVGLSQREIARQLECSSRRVGELLAELQAELVAIAGVVDGA